MSDMYSLFEMTGGPSDKGTAGDPIATVNTLGEAVATLELRVAVPGVAANRFLLQKNDKPLLTLQEARARLISENKLGLGSK